MEFHHSLLDIILWGNQWLHCKMSAVFPVYFWTHLYMYDIHSTANGITWCWMPFNPSTTPWLSFQLLLSTEIVSKDCNDFMIKFNMNLWKTYYLNFGVKNYMKVDHRSYRRNFCNCKKKDWKKFRLVQDSNPWPLWYRCSALTNWATSKLGADRYMWTVGWIRIMWK